MKSIQKIFKKNIVFVIFFLVLGFVIFVAVSYLLVLPRFLSFLSIKLENEITKIEIVDLENNIRDTKAIDEAESSKFFSLVDNLIPESEDVIRSVALAEEVAKSLGVTLDSFDTNTEQVVPGQTVTASPQAQESTPIQGMTAVSTSSNSYEMAIAVNGSFSGITKFISNFLKTDRLLGINDVSLTTLGGGGVAATLTVVFPLGTSTTTIEIGDDLVLTAVEREQLAEIKGRIFSASPSNNPLGPADPFK